jgi:uridylate kinase
LRASEVHADALLKGTKVDGLYTADPVKNAGALLLKRTNYQYLLENGLTIMDAAAVSLCQNAHIPIRIFNIRVAGNIRRVVLGEDVGSTVLDTPQDLVESPG